MEESEELSVFYNSPSGWKEVEKEKKYLFEKRIFFDNAKKLVLCPYHCRWEKGEQTGEYSAKTECGKEIEGFVSYKIKDDEPLPKESSGIYLRHLDLYKDNEEFYNLYRGRTQEEDKNLNDIDFFSRYYAITVFYSLKDLRATITFYELDYEKIESLKEGNLALSVIPFKKYENIYTFRGYKRLAGERRTYSKIEERCTFSSNYIKASLPYIIQNRVEEIADKLLERFAGKKITTYKSLFRGQNYLNALVHCPYEIAFFDIYEPLIYQYNNLLCDEDRANSNFYNITCERLGFKSFPSLRKCFEIRPRSLLDYKNLVDAGFTDKNIMISAIKDSSLPIFKDTYFWREIEPIQFFCAVSIPIRGEKATMTALNREPKLSSYSRFDTLRMFKTLYPLLETEERDTIIKEGLTEKNHDLLSKISSRELNKNIEFDFGERELSLDGSALGYDFEVIRNTDALHALGSVMHNCVYSYRDKVLAKKCVIVRALKDGKEAMCIEVSYKDGIVQALGLYNRLLSRQEEEALSEWWRKNKKFIGSN